mmetsp:Transcript_35439/g.49644  ORF Transcript_35439/g.49644 Transcript_35439/m.49644 type:complete len:96 (-) Transcript_35439:1112-1399(-)
MNFKYIVVKDTLLKGAKVAGMWTKMTPDVLHITPVTLPRMVHDVIRMANIQPKVKDCTIGCAWSFAHKMLPVWHDEARGYVVDPIGRVIVTREVS